MNLYDLMMGAQGGQGVNTLASQFGLSQQQTQAALQAMMPAFAAGFQKSFADPMGFGALMTQMTNAAHAQSYANPAAAAAVAAATSGPAANVVGQIFGSQQIAQQVSQQAAQASGVSAQIIQQMLPIVASMLIGGVSSAMAAQGLGGLLAQLPTQLAANASLAQGGAAANPALNASQMFGNWMTMVNSMMSGAAGGGAAAPQAAAMQAGLTALNSLMQAGVQVSQAQQQGLNEIFAAMSKVGKA